MQDPTLPPATHPLLALCAHLMRDLHADAIRRGKLRALEVPMQHQAVTSTMFSSVARDGDTLEVVFRSSGARYRITGVPEKVIDQFLASESMGQAYNGLLKGRFQTERIVEDEERQSER